MIPFKSAPCGWKYWTTTVHLYRYLQAPHFWQNAKMYTKIHALCNVEKDISLRIQLISTVPKKLPTGIEMFLPAMSVTKDTFRLVDPAFPAQLHHALPGNSDCRADHEMACAHHAQTEFPQTQGIQALVCPLMLTVAVGLACRDTFCSTKHVFFVLLLIW